MKVTVGGGVRQKPRPWLSPAPSPVTALWVYEMGHPICAILTLERLRLRQRHCLPPGPTAR